MDWQSSSKAAQSKLLAMPVPYANSRFSSHPPLAMRHPSIILQTSSESMTDRYHPYSSYTGHNVDLSPGRHVSRHYHDQAHPYRISPISLPLLAYTDDASIKITDRVRRKCSNCSTIYTTTWRRSTINTGKVVCNKCGLFERTHGRPRPHMIPSRRDASRLSRYPTSSPASVDRVLGTDTTYPHHPPDTHSPPVYRQPLPSIFSWVERSASSTDTHENTPSSPRSNLPYESHFNPRREAYGNQVNEGPLDPHSSEEEREVIFGTL